MTPDRCVYRTVGGHELLADVYVPQGARQPPVIIWLHPGGMIFGSRRHLPGWQLRRYLDGGYAVVAVDYRLAPEVHVDGVVSDVVEAYHWVTGTGADRFGFDPGRVALVGHSAGAYLAMMCACRVDSPPSAVVSVYGYASLGEWASMPNERYREMFNLDEQIVAVTVGQAVVSDYSDLSLHGRFGFYVFTRQQGTWLSAVCGDGREDNANWLSEFEPLRHLTERFPPTLLLHGDADVDVPVERSIEVADALSDLGVEHQLVVYPGWGHIFDVDMSDLSNPPDDPAVVSAIDTAVKFLNSRLRG